MKKTTKNWPIDGKPANFGEIAPSLFRAMKHCYKLIRQNEDKDVPWGGLPLGEHEKATCLEPQEHLSAENLKYSLENQGRDAMEEIIGLAVRLGVEQGRRIIQKEWELSFILLKLKTESLNGEIADMIVKTKGG